MTLFLITILFFFYSGNVLFADSRDAATALHGLSDALLLYKSQDNLEGIPDDVEVIDANSIDYPVPPNRWKLGKPHPKAKYLLLRFANNGEFIFAYKLYFNITYFLYTTISNPSSFYFCLFSFLS